MYGRTGILKEFGPEGLKVLEEVAEKPSLREHKTSGGPVEETFCLRIDADEFTPETFELYYPLFEKFGDAITVFFNVFSFEGAGDHILKCRDLGVDIQSHAFYHHTYNDYECNRYNIAKAKDFFSGLGIDTIGFAAPYGRWNAELMRALEDEGYKYSSDFAYDYAGYPSYPVLKEGSSAVLEIPIFPVAPELFFQNADCDTEIVKKYYIKVLDELVKNKLPAIIYAHTSVQYGEIPSLLEDIVDHAVNIKGLKPINMTSIHDSWTSDPGAETEGTPDIEPDRTIGTDLFGEKVNAPVLKRLKGFIKNIIDFEKVTPAEELCCGEVKKTMKLIARKFL